MLNIKHQTNKRQSNYVFQLKSSFFYKFFSIITNFLIVSILVRLVGTEQYGVWATIYGSISLILILDFGVGNGVQNKISKAFAYNKIKSISSWINNGVFSAFLISSSIGIITLVIYTLLKYYNIDQRIDSILVKNSFNSIFVILLSVLIVLVINVVLKGYMAIQRSATMELIQLSINVLFLSLIGVGQIFTNINILFLSISYSITIICVRLYFAKLFTKSQKILFSRKLLSSTQIKYIFQFGGKFFFIQIFAVILHTSDRIIITSFVSPQDTTNYDITMRVLSLITVAFLMLTRPLWAIFSEAFAKNDFLWIKKTITKLERIFIFIFCIMPIIIYFLPIITNLLGGNQINITIKSIMLCSAIIMVQVFTNIYTPLLNGVGKINSQLTFGFVASLINLPLSYYLSVILGLKMDGVLYATLICISPFAIFSAFQTHFILRNGSL